MNEQQVHLAIRAHERIDAGLRGTPDVLLGATRRQSPHRGTTATLEETSAPRDFRELRDLIARGTPRWAFDLPISLPSPRQAYEHAASVGYVVDRPSFTTRTASVTEQLAWTAARGILTETYPSLWADRQYPDRLALRERVATVLPYFIVPDVDEARPHLVDQLWIVTSLDGAASRWIALEIEGEHRRSERERAHDAARTAAMVEMGFEVIRVAGWWVRIDPFRAIAEFLRAAGLLRARYKLVGEERFRTLAEYVCDCCRNPMVRRTEDAILEVAAGPDEEPRLVHSGCEDDALDGDWTPAGERRTA
jgi:hypothetical protein